MICASSFWSAASCSVSSSIVKECRSMSSESCAISSSVARTWSFARSISPSRIALSRSSDAPCAWRFPMVASVFAICFSSSASCSSRCRRSSGERSPCCEYTKKGASTIKAHKSSVTILALLPIIIPIQYTPSLTLTSLRDLRKKRVLDRTLQYHREIRTWHVQGVAQGQRQS